MSSFRAGSAFEVCDPGQCLDTIIAMVEAGHGSGVIPFFALPVRQYQSAADAVSESDYEPRPLPDPESGSEAFCGGC